MAKQSSMFSVNLIKKHSKVPERDPAPIFSNATSDELPSSLATSPQVLQADSLLMWKIWEIGSGCTLLLENGGGGWGAALEAIENNTKKVQGKFNVQIWNLCNQNNSFGESALLPH